VPFTITLRRVLTPVCLSMVAACASAGAGAGPPVTAAHASVETWTDPLSSGRGFRVMFRNNTAEPVRITTITLYDCQNADHACTNFDPRLVIAPGQSAEALTIGPALTNYEFTFRYRFTWATGR
jgi:hypothetical protein